MQKEELENVVIKKRGRPKGTTKTENKKLENTTPAKRGRPKDCDNFMLNINWGQLCINLGLLEEFTVPEDCSYIQYNIGKGESIRIYRELLDEMGLNKIYHTTYNYKGLVIPCQDLTNDNMLDSFLNKLLMDNWDFQLKGRIELFSMKKNSNSKKDDYDELDEMD